MHVLITCFFLLGGGDQVGIHVLSTSWLVGGVGGEGHSIVISILLPNPVETVASKAHVRHTHLMQRASFS